MSGTGSLIPEIGNAGLTQWIWRQGMLPGDGVHSSGPASMQLELDHVGLLHWDALPPLTVTIMQPSEMLQGPASGTLASRTLHCVTAIDLLPQNERTWSSVQLQVYVQISLPQHTQLYAWLTLPLTQLLHNRLNGTTDIHV